MTSPDTYISRLTTVDLHPNPPAPGACEGFHFDAAGNPYQCMFTSVRELNSSTWEVARDTPDPTASAGASSGDVRLTLMGMTLLGDKMLVVTWNGDYIVEYSLSNLQPVRNISVPFGGFANGIEASKDGTTLFVTVLCPEGSTLLHLDAATFAVTARLPLIDARLNATDASGKVTATLGRQVGCAAELELVGDELWASIDSYGPGPMREGGYEMDWGPSKGPVVAVFNPTKTAEQGSPCFVRIDPATGAVLGYIDARPLLQAAPEPSLAAGYSPNFSGVARAPDGRIYVTGKEFKHIYEVGVEPAPELGTQFVEDVCNLGVMVSDNATLAKFSMLMGP